MNARLHTLLLHYFNEIVILTVETLQSGLINSTYKSETSQGTFIIQKINQEVFPNIGELLHNKTKVVAYLQNHNFPTIEFLKTFKDSYYVDTEEGIWQVSRYISSCVQHKIDSPEMAAQLGGYLARFHSALTDFPVSELEITIPDFHNTEKRFNDLCASSTFASKERLLNAHKDIEYIKENFQSVQSIAVAIQKKTIPERVVHNDTKVSNFLFSENGELLTIIDFDTVMPGSVLHDIGDALRTGASTAPEDEQDLTKVAFNVAIYTAFITAYIKEGQSFLTPEELNAIHFSLPLILLEQACRFLEDYLRNDTYYEVQYDTHNLVRTRTQLHLFEHVKQYLNKQFNIL
ncbi:MAG: phosphotransferase [Bizionia sp.]|nr:phosphotransferase [Bizionia sp.]